MASILETITSLPGAAVQAAQSTLEAVSDAVHLGSNESEENKEGETKVEEETNAEAGKPVEEKKEQAGEEVKEENSAADGEKTVLHDVKNFQLKVSAIVSRATKASD